MRYYLIEAITKDGEYEYLNRMVTEEKLNLPWGRAEKIAKKFFGFPGGHQEIKVTGIHELTENEYNVLKRFL